MLVESETNHDEDGSMKVSSMLTKWGESAGLVSRASGPLVYGNGEESSPKDNLYCLQTKQVNEVFSLEVFRGSCCSAVRLHAMMVAGSHNRSAVNDRLSTVFYIRGVTGPAMMIANCPRFGKRYAWRAPDTVPSTVDS